MKPGFPNYDTPPMPKIKDFETILKEKREYYGNTEAAICFAAEEFAREQNEKKQISTEPKETITEQELYDRVLEKLEELGFAPEFMKDNDEHHLRAVVHVFFQHCMDYVRISEDDEMDFKLRQIGSVESVKDFVEENFTEDEARKRIEEDTESSMKLVSDFIDHVKRETGKRISNRVFLSFF